MSEFIGRMINRKWARQRIESLKITWNFLSLWWSLKCFMVSWNSGTSRSEFLRESAVAEVCGELSVRDHEGNVLSASKLGLLGVWRCFTSHAIQTWAYWKCLPFQMSQESRRCSPHTFTGRENSVFESTFVALFKEQPMIREVFAGYGS